MNCDLVLILDVLIFVCCIVIFIINMIEENFFIDIKI